MSTFNCHSAGDEWAKNLNFQTLSRAPIKFSKFLPNSNLIEKTSDKYGYIVLIRGAISVDVG